MVERLETLEAKSQEQSIIPPSAPSGSNQTVDVSKKCRDTMHEGLPHRPHRQLLAQALDLPSPCPYSHIPPSNLRDDYNTEGSSQNGRLCSHLALPHLIPTSSKPCARVNGNVRGHVGMATTRVQTKQKLPMDW